MGVIGHTLLFEYPLVNTWMDEVTTEPLDKNNRTYTPWSDICCSSGPINTTVPLFILHKFQMPPSYQSIPRVFSKCFECVL
jgi:hypothetical protein